MSRRIQITVGLGLGALFLFLFFRQANFREVGAHLRHANYWLVAAAVALSVLAMVQRAARWHYLLAPLKSIGLGSLVACTMMGWAVTALLPGRLGEVARAILVGRREKVSKTAAFATVVFERFFDLLTILLLLAIYLVFFPLPSALNTEGRSIIAALRLSGLVALAAALAGASVIVGLQRWPQRSEVVVGRILRLMPGRLNARLSPLGRSFLDGFAGMRQLRLLTLIALHSVLLWGTIAASYYLLFRAFRLDVPYYAVLPLIVVIVVGVMVPTPAAVGSFHKAAQIGLATLWRVPNDLAVSYAIISHAVAFLPVTIIGIVLLSREGLSLAAVQRLQRESAG
ncbi:MAG: lysylphosphatidylglycerol synthase transmembrane domain-containing protein [Acidobacteriota bacterium]